MANGLQVWYAAFRGGLEIQHPRRPRDSIALSDLAGFGKGNGASCVQASWISRCELALLSVGGSAQSTLDRISTLPYETYVLSWKRIIQRALLLCGLRDRPHSRSLACPIRGSVQAGLPRDFYNWREVDCVSAKIAQLTSPPLSHALTVTVVIAKGPCLSPSCQVKELTRRSKSKPYIASPTVLILEQQAIKWSVSSQTFL